MIEPWSEEERKSAFVIFKKIENNNRAWLASLHAGEMPASYPMPQDLYEAHRLTMKSISSEIGVFDEQGRILLILRPSSSESSVELFPSLWHIPGTRHIANETNEEALQRLLESEIGAKPEARFVTCKEYTVKGGDTLSLLFSLLYVAYIPSGSVDIGEKRRWFETRALPVSILEEHRAIVDLLVIHAHQQTSG